MMELVFVMIIYTVLNSISIHIWILMLKVISNTNSLWRKLLFIIHTIAILNFMYWTIELISRHWCI